MARNLDSLPRHEERLLIFSNNPGSKTGDGGRAHAERMVNEMVQDRLRVSFWWNDVLFNELRLLRIHWVCLKLSELGDTTW